MQQELVPLIRFGEQSTYEDISETDIMDVLTDAQERYSNLIDGLWLSTSVIGVAHVTIGVFRTFFYNTLFLLSVFSGLPFHLFFSLLLCCLMITGSILASNIIVGGHQQLWGKGFYLLAQMLFFFTSEGRMVVLTFSIILLLFLFYPPSSRMRYKPHMIFLAFVCLLLACISRGVFIVAYGLFCLQCILLWNALNVTKRNALIMVIFFFFPFAFSAVSSTYLSLGILPAESHGIVGHGSLARWAGYRQSVQGSYLLIQYCIAMLPFVPRLSKTLWLDSYFHVFCLSLVVGGAFAAPNIGSCLLLLNALLLKITLLDNRFLQNRLRQCG